MEIISDDDEFISFLAIRMHARLLCLSHLVIYEFVFIEVSSSIKRWRFGDATMHNKQSSVREYAHHTYDVIICPRVIPFCIRIADVTDTQRHRADE